MTITGPSRVIVGISGASGVSIGVRILELLAESAKYESHLILTHAGGLSLAVETDYTLRELHELATVTHKMSGLGDSIASGSFPVVGMAVAPCSIKSLSAIANSYSDSLLARAADVTLKEGRPLILAVRETPLHLGHLKLMAAAAESGAIIMPPVPAFYSSPKTIEDVVDRFARRILVRMGLHEFEPHPWTGMG